MKSLLAIGVICVCLCGCVSHAPPPPATAVSPQAGAAPPSAAQSGAVRPDATGQKALVAGTAASNGKLYHVVIRNGKKLYCSESVSTGSHIQGDPVCLSEERWQRINYKSQEILEQVIRSNTPLNEGTMH